jgi:SAM-dependent methyltransferase
MPDLLHTSPARGFMAEHAHYSDDSGFWDAHAMRLGGPVLDLGAAAGRVAIPIALLGVPVVAVDSDPEMLDVLRARAEEAGVAALVETIEGRMGACALPRDTALAIVPMNTLQVLVGADERDATFRDVAACLRPGGEFVFDLSVPDLDDIADRLGDVIPTGTHLDADSGALLVHTAVYDAIDPDTRTLDFRVIVDRTLPDGTPVHDERTHHVHLYTPEEVRALALNARLEIVALDGGFAGERFDPERSERQVWRCRRPQLAA